MLRSLAYQLAVGNYCMQSLAALQTVHLAFQALSNAVQAAVAANPLGNHVSGPPMIAQMGGLRYLVPEAMKLVLSLRWKSPRSALTN